MSDDLRDHDLRVEPRALSKFPLRDLTFVMGPGNPGHFERGGVRVDAITDLSTSEGTMDRDGVGLASGMRESAMMAAKVDPRARRFEEADQPGRQSLTEEVIGLLAMNRERMGDLNTRLAVRRLPLGEKVKLLVALKQQLTDAQAPLRAELREASRS